jgi:hypothetical protein
MTRPHHSFFHVLLLFLLAAAFPTQAHWQPAASPPGDAVDTMYPAGHELYCSSYLGKVYVTTDQAQTWVEVGALNHATNIHSLLLIDDWLLISRQGWGGNHRIGRTADGWTSWEPLPRQDHELGTMTAWDGGIVAILDGAIVHSPDHGLTWNPYPVPDERRVMRLHRVDAVLFAETFEFGQQGWHLHRLAAGGTWQDVTGALAPLTITAWGAHQGAIYLVRYLGGASGEVHRSLDGGQTFDLYQDMPHPGTAPSSFASAGPLLAVGFPTSISPSCFLRENSASWEDFSQGLDAPQINQLVAQGGYLYKTGSVVGIMRAPLPAVSAAPDTPLAPLAHLSVQPNPFNPRTEVVFAAPQAARLTIHDARGRRVLAVPVGESGRWTWDGADHEGRALPSGSYLLRLEAGGKVLAREGATLVR